MDILIPARGGSKGIPRKNLIDLNGKSLLQRSIECALSAAGVDNVSCIYAVHKHHNFTYRH